MKKRTLALAALLTLGFAMTAHAYEEPKWLINQNEYKQYRDGEDQWWIAEGKAEVRQWAQNNSADIKGIADEDARYQACVRKVCDFLSYDLKYTQPMIYYTLRDGKGVCADYTTLTKALCDEVGIKAVISTGVLYGDSHSMLKVTVNGAEHFSDPTGVDSGATTVYQMTPGYVEENVCGADELGITWTGADKGEWTDQQMSCPEGYVAVYDGKSKSYYYITQKDSDDWDNDIVTAAYIKNKYGIE
mgnify:CR=1 FL=1